MRRSRFSRDKSRTTFLNTKEKEAVLHLLAQYKYLRTTSLRALLPERSPKGLYVTLRALFDEGLLEKPKERRRGFNHLYTPDIWMLSERGEQYLIERGRRPEQITRLYRHMTDGPVKNFAHAMMICDALSSIHAGVLKTDAAFIPWTEIVAKTSHPKPMKLPCRFDHKGTNMSTFVVPDGLFGIRYPNNQVSFFALEAEHYNPVEPNTNLARASTLKKLLCYRDIINSGVFKTQLAIPNLRVLIVTPNEARARHSRELAERLFGKTNLFLFHHIPVQEDLLKAPPPMPELFTLPWQRAGMEEAPLYKEIAPQTQG